MTDAEVREWLLSLPYYQLLRLEELLQEMMPPEPPARKEECSVCHARLCGRKTPCLEHKHKGRGKGGSGGASGSSFPPSALATTGQEYALRLRFWRFCWKNVRSMNALHAFRFVCSMDHPCHCQFSSEAKSDFFRSLSETKSDFFVSLAT